MTKKSGFSAICILTVTFIVVISVFLVIAISPDRISGDFDVYYHAGQHFLAKAPLYIPHHGIEEFKYLPMFAFIFSPLTLFNETSALYIWSILSILLFYFMFYLLYQLKQVSFNSIRDFLIIVCLFALTGRYLFDNIKVGQANILLCFLMLLTIYLEIKKKDFWCGLVLAFSLMIKFFPLLLLFYFVLNRRYKIAAYTLPALAFFLLLPAVYSGLNLNVQYLHDWFVLLKSSPATLMYSAKNDSLLAFFSWVFIVRHQAYSVMDYNQIMKGLTPEVYGAWALTSLVLFGLFFYDIFSSKSNSAEKKYLDYSCLFVCGLLINPLAYFNALILLTIPYMLILRYLFLTQPRPKYFFSVSFLLFLGFVLLTIDDHALFKNNWVYDGILDSKPLFWTMMSAYLSLWLMKLSQKQSKA